MVYVTIVVRHKFACPAPHGFDVEFLFRRANVLLISTAVFAKNKQLSLTCFFYLPGHQAKLGGAYAK